MAGSEIVVVGAGVIGLSTAVCLAERGHDVQVLSDLQPVRTTSAVASAMIGPVIAPSDSPVAAWGHASVETFTALAREPDTGVRMRRGLLASRDAAGPAPPGDLQPCDPDELPTGFAGGFWANLPLVDMVPYLEYLLARLTAAAGRLELRHVDSLEQLAEEAALLVNCSGVGARELANDASVEPVLGQHVIVENPGIDRFFMEAPFKPEWAAYWPYPDHVVIGGVKRPGDESTEPDPELAERMLKRCVEVEPRLAGARVIGHQVGLRPNRPEPRLDAETIGGARCVHSYGHGGSGVTHSWGAARTAADLLLADGRSNEL